MLMYSRYILAFVCCLHFINANVINYSEPNKEVTNELVHKPASWLKSAQNMVHSPTGHVVVQVAKELLNRSAGNSQVLSLNVTNLLIILLLKILIFSAAFLSAGQWSGGYGAYGYGRSLDSGNMASGLTLANGEDYLITGFLAAQGAGIDDCLYAAACANPSVAYEYARAAKAVLEGIKNFEGASLENPRYNDLIGVLERAAYDGYRGVACDTKAKCDNLL